MNQRLKFGDSFCVLPWIESYYDTQGKKKFCCYTDVILESDESAEKLRNKIWAGEKIADCKKCYELEIQKVISPRQIESSRWLKDYDVASIFKSNICPESKILFLDIRRDNKCNLACISCNPYESSLWAKELNIPIINIDKNIDFDLTNIKKIYLAGGEPLLIKSTVDLLTRVANDYSNIEIVINTNLSILPERFIETINKLKNVALIVSIDAWGTVNEYHRYPLVWSKFINNLELLTETSAKINFNTVIDAVSIFGLSGLNELQHIPENWNLSVLHTPSWLELPNIPVKLKSHALAQLQEFANKNKFYSSDVAFNSKIKLIEKLIVDVGDETTFVDKIKNIDDRRKIHHNEYLNLNFY